MVILRSFIYLHGFASSPKSAKAQFFKDSLAQAHIDLQIPDLNAGDFSQLTITRQLTQVAADFPEDTVPVTLIGSSLGGLVAAHLAQRHPQVERLILLAPAFGFLSHYLPKLGDRELQSWQQRNYLMVYHHGEGQSLPLSYNFVVDASQYHEDVLQRPLPTLVFHGSQDDVIPITASRKFVQLRPWTQLVELECDHTLDKVTAEIWPAIRSFCQLPEISN